MLLFLSLFLGGVALVALGLLVIAWLNDAPEEVAYRQSTSRRRAIADLEQALAAVRDPAGPDAPAVPEACRKTRRASVGRPLDMLRHGFMASDSATPCGPLAPERKDLR